MKRYRTFTVIGLMAALLLSACSQDELAENSTALPEGEYPLQIGSVSLTAEVSEQPWTRVSENQADGMSSVWKDGDKIGVRIGDNEETGIYVVDVDIEGSVVGVTPEKPVYWKDKQPATITAWYPLDEELDFTLQDQGLTYLLKATGNGNYQSTPINLNFTHQLAKVRVKLEGAKANEVAAVTVRSYEGTNNEQGTPNGRIGTDVYVPMLKATYGGETYWEANLLEGYLDADNTFRVSSDGKNFVQAKLTTDVDITPGHVHTIKIDVGEAQPVEGEISGDGYYLVSEARNEPVTITGGSPTVYLKGASINVSDGPAINITGGNPTIHVFGKNNTITSSNGAGIYVAEGYSVTIKGNNTDDELTVTGDNGGAGIGGYYAGNDPYYTAYSCGNINISNITLTASGDMHIWGYASAGIGATGDGTVGKINIVNAVVYATGNGIVNYGGAAIGGGSSGSSAGQTAFDISISNSEIHATKGSSYASYIGAGGDISSRPANYNIISTAKITNSTIYNESGIEITQ